MMKLTLAQKAILSSSGNIKINAVAGSGKTTTIIEYAKSQPSTTRILYLAFNKSVKLDASRKFQLAGVKNISVETAHSMAYKAIVFDSPYVVNKHGYKTQDIVRLLGLKRLNEPHTEYILANHINKFAAYFCNSDKLKVQDLDYRKVVADPEAQAFVHQHYEQIVQNTRIFLAKMNNAEIEITHDFYLKKFQLNKPTLRFDYLLFDEGQDASEVMLDIFLRQKGTKVIVGDTHQQIYSWRYAINSLEKTDFPQHQLSISFRFGSDIAQLAKQTLVLKKHLKNPIKPDIQGKGKTGKISSKAIIARTNLGLLLKAIEYMSEKPNLKKIYFEGNIHSYTYADDGTSLYDVLNLYNEKKHLIRDPLIKQIKDVEELEDYIKKTDDGQLGMMLEIVREYEQEIPGLIKMLKEKHVDHDSKEEAEIIFSTVHRCKGMEYDSVQLVNDFITEDRIESQLSSAEGDVKNLYDRLNEEINLLYVAITRTKSKLQIPEALVPKDFPHSKSIRVLRTAAAKNAAPPKGRTYIEYENQRSSKYRSLNYTDDDSGSSYTPWTKELEKELTELHHDGFNTRELSQHFGRSKGAIRSRLKKLGLGT